MRSEFGERLVRLREDRYLKQATLARAVGVPPQTLSNWEMGKARVPAEVLPGLAEALGVSYDELLGGVAPQRGHRRSSDSVAEYVATQLLDGWDQLPAAEQQFLREIAEATERFRVRLLEEEGLNAQRGAHAA